MGQEEVQVVVAVPGAGKHSRYFVLRERLFDRLWVYDVLIVGDAAVLSRLLVVGREHQVHIILVA